RYEAYSTTYTGEDIERNLYDDEVFIDVDDFYPSINLIYSVSNSFNLRGSYSRTTARPSFKENSSANIYDPITERFFLGNPDLNPTYVNNLDLKAEYFGEGNEAASISLFYKQFNDPIELFYFNVNTPNVLIARNNESATVFGAELDLKKNLLDSAVDRLSFNLNASLIVSELTMGDAEYEGRKINAPDREIDRERQLQGQSPYLINSGLTYNIFDKSLEAGLFYNVQGRALQVIGVGQFPDVYTEPFHSLNFNLSKGLGADGNKVISLKVENLLNDAIESRFDYFGDTSFLFSQLNPGINTSLGFTYKF
ncbi:MAG: TonB-dependent receptor plug domain-containing protein, partial [Flavobacteriaceae bacterium]